MWGGGWKREGGGGLERGLLVGHSWMIVAGRGHTGGGPEISYEVPVKYLTR